MVDHAYDPNAAAPSGQAEPNGGDGERVAKALARAGVASRREIERLIAAGRVKLNGKVLDTPAVKIAPSDVLMVDGAIIGQAEATRVWRYHKPAGLVTTHSDPKGRPTVFAHLPEGLPRVISVGRLDLNTEGLLLLTNDGALARALELPATGIARRYRARARGVTSQAKLDSLKDGIVVEGVHYGPIEARLEKAKESTTGTNLWITLMLTEGKNREVRKVLDALGLTVNRLIRLSYGPFQLGTLAVGEAEEIGPRVIREQLASHIEAASLPTGDRVIEPSAKSGPPRRGGGALSRDAAPKKPEYKPGWARPKKRPGPVHAKPVRARSAVKTDTPARGGPKKDGPKAGGSRAGTPKTGGPARVGPKRDGSKRGGPKPRP
jgi:23S rRNA pseudouridine2605 synthase